MAITVTERFGSGESTVGKNGKVVLRYILRGSDDDKAVKAAMLNASPASYDGLNRENGEVENVGPYLWYGTVYYVPADKQPQTGDDSFTFETGGGTQHITQSLQTVHKYAPSGKTAPDFHGAIGVTHDSVEGVDITVPVYRWSQTHYLSNDVVSDQYKGKLFALTSKTNNATFKGCAAGEALFMGASGSKRVTENDWAVTFNFAAGPNRTDLTVGDITGISKKGWEYMWVRYQDAEDATAKALVKKPVAVYIEKVYDEGNFADLGIGT